MNAALDAATAKVRAAADALARAYNYEHELEDLRAAIKADAIKRIMLRDNCAATPAEKVVETDPDYFTHREKQRASVVERFKADAEYWAAKVEATQASLITPNVLALQADHDLLLHQVEDLAEARSDALVERDKAQAETFSLGIEVADLHNQLKDAKAANLALVSDLALADLKITDLTNQVRDEKSRWENMKMGAM